MLQNILEDCKKQLFSALKHKKHPFRFFTLATSSPEGGSHLRTVVLRDFDPEQMQFTIFTDTRSKKVADLNRAANAQFLFYDGTRLIQLVVDAEMVSSTNNTTEYQSLPEPSKKDYASKQTPGTPIDAPDHISHDFSKGNFTKIVFQAERLEHLRLKRPNHIRAEFRASDHWKGRFLAP
jgi:pyridoxine/pyridoxamine 5'-phosphate oxidase|tara:strand:+ start:1420 stop:1956 length:537 start_codon:yes stop_codon:yes gene_type:complete